MKLVMIFLSICLSLSHQQYGGFHRTMLGVFPWVRVPPSYYQKLPIYNNLMDTSEDGEIGRMDLINNHQPSIDDEEEDFSDITESRAKGIQSYRSRPNYLNDPQNARFLFNLLASTSNTFNNPLLKTATFTVTQTLSLTNVVRCVPINQVIANPPTCARRRRHSFDGEMEGEEYSIDPSETLGMVPTALSSSLPQDRSISDSILSTKDDTISDEISKAHYSLRDKRFLINKNQFVVSSVVTTFAFVNSTITATVNLLNPLPAPPAVGVAPAACVPAVAGVLTPGTCVSCLPIGFIICPAATG